MITVVTNADTGATLYVVAETPAEAMKSARKAIDPKSRAEPYKHENFLFMNIGKETYCTKA